MLPQCITLDCSHCTALTEVPLNALPQCEEFYHSGCDALTVFPELVQQDQNFGGLRNSVNISTEELNTHPKKVLRQFTVKIIRSSSGIAIPSVQFYDKNNRPSVGVDLGGLSRHLQSTLFEKLFEKEGSKICLPFKNDEKKRIIPFVSAPSDITDYYAVGKLLGRAYKGSLPIGRHFNSNVFKAMLSLSKKEMPKDFGKLKNIPYPIKEKLFFKLNDSYAFVEKYLNNKKMSKKENEAMVNFIDDDFCFAEDQSQKQKDKILKKTPQKTKLVREKLLKMIAGKENVMKAIIALAGGMQYFLGREWPSKGKGEEIQEKIEGRLDVNFLISNNLAWDAVALNNPNDPNVSKIKTYLEKWLRKLTPSQLRKFVKIVTGSTSLIKKEKIKIVLTENSSAYPRAHTCFYKLDVPVYGHEKILIEKMNYLLAHGLDGTGFSDE